MARGRHRGIERRTVVYVCGLWEHWKEGRVAPPVVFDSLLPHGCKVQAVQHQRVTVELKAAWHWAETSMETGDFCTV